MTQASRSRQARVERVTRETRIRAFLDLDGTGKARIQTPVSFLNHMLEQVARHGLLDLEIEAEGDVQVDDHHTVEDVGIVLGEALRQALGDKSGIVRYGSAWIPLDESLTLVALDLCDRPYLVYRVPLPSGVRLGTFDPSLAEDFFQALVNHGRLTLHVHLLCGRNPHHILETVFKGFARALGQAVQRDPRVGGLPTTKGRFG